MKPRIQIADAKRFKHERSLGYRWLCSDGVHHAIASTPMLAYQLWARQRQRWGGLSAK
jgi:hypothetical protein